MINISAHTIVVNSCDPFAAVFSIEMADFYNLRRTPQDVLLNFKEQYGP